MNDVPRIGEGEGVKQPNSDDTPEEKVGEEILNPPRATSGKELAVRREKRGVSVEQVSRELRIHSRFILAMEADEWFQLPPGPYTTGFIRSYARYLGLDETELLENRSKHVKARPRPKTKSASDISAREARPTLGLVIAGLVVLSLVLFIWWLGGLLNPRAFSRGPIDKLEIVLPEMLTHFSHEGVGSGADGIWEQVTIVLFDSAEIRLRTDTEMILPSTKYEPGEQLTLPAVPGLWLDANPAASVAWIIGTNEPQLFTGKNGPISERLVPPEQESLLE